MKYFLLSVILLLSLTQAAKFRLLQTTAPACQSHNDCPTNSYCDYQTYTCTPRGCVDSVDCPGSSCKDKYCVTPWTDSANNGSAHQNCTESSECQNGQVCYLASCYTTPENATDCAQDSDCLAGFWCRLDKCLYIPKGACIRSADCASDETC